jgi:hypothetical protein
MPQERAETLKPCSASRVEPFPGRVVQVSSHRLTVTHPFGRGK